MKLNFISIIFYCEIISVVFLAIISLIRNVNVNQIRRRNIDADILSIFSRPVKPSKKEIEQERKKLKKVSTLCWVVSIIFVLIGIIFLLTFGGGGDAEETKMVTGVITVGSLLSLLGLAHRYFYKKLGNLF